MIRLIVCALVVSLCAAAPELLSQTPPGGRVAPYEHIAHGDVRLTFQRDAAAGFLRIRRLQERGGELGFDFVSRPLWRLELLDFFTGETQAVTPEEVSGPVELLSRPDGKDLLLEARWPTCVVEDDVFAVTVQARLRGEGLQTEWRVAVESPDAIRYSVQSAELRLALAAPEGESLFAIVPYRGSLEIRDPQTTLQFNGAAPNIGQKLNAQLFPVYTSGGTGLYLAAHDPEWHYKRLRTSGDGEAYLLGLQAYAEDQVTPGKSFVQPYPWVVGLYEGDWYDAGQIYREFAKEQAWLRHGPLHQRSDVPTWWKELDLLELHTFEESDSVAHTLDGYRSVRDFYGIPEGGLAVAHWAWFDTFGSYESLPKFQQTIDGLKAAGVRSLPYLWSYAYDSGHPSYGSQGVHSWTKKSYFGNALFDPFAPWRVVVLDPSVPAWQSRVGTVLDRLATDGFYLDNPFEIHPDFDAYRDRRGYERDIIWGFHSLMSSVRSHQRSTNPDFVTTYESMFEGFIDVADMIAPENPYEYNPVSKDGSARYVPLYDTVYHDYTVTLLANSKMDFFRARHFVDLDDAVYTLAHGFSLGKMLSSVESLFEVGGVPNHLVYLSPVQRYVGALKRYIQARRRYRDFLVYGQLLRPLDTSATPVTKTLIEPRSKDEYRVDVPSELSSVWRSPDGRVGILLVNYRKTDTHLTYRFDFEAYGLTTGASHRLLDGRTGWPIRTVSDDFEETVSLPALEYRFFILE
ncbi:MAG: DUF6259 domain-containing protein [Planctomycetota bacterium]